MSTFLNIDLDKKPKLNLIAKHIFFSIFWLSGILIFIFRFDLMIEPMYYASIPWIEHGLPFLYLIALLIYFVFIEWYYIVAFFFYPLLIFFWFIPKTILKVGKIYMLGNYFNIVISSFYNLKLSIIHSIILIISFFSLFVLENNFIRYFIMLSFTYFYCFYLFKFISKAFKKPTLFGDVVEQKFKGLINRDNKDKSFLLDKIIIQKDDEKLEIEVRKEKQIKRVLLMNFCIELLKSRLHGYRGKQAYMYSWFFGAFVFLFFSILFFWFLNFQLYKIDYSHFQYNGAYLKFDFLYYTLKTITFGDIELVKPVSIWAKSIEIISFFTIGIFILVIFVSVLLSMKQDRMYENVKLTADLIDFENTIVVNYMKNELGTELNAAKKEIKNIQESFNYLQNIIDRFF